MNKVVEVLLLVLGAKDNELLRDDPAELPFEDTVFSI